MPVQTILFLEKSQLHIKPLRRIFHDRRSVLDVYVQNTCNLRILHNQCRTFVLCVSLYRSLILVLREDLGRCDCFSHSLSVSLNYSENTITCCSSDTKLLHSTSLHCTHLVNPVFVLFFLVLFVFYLLFWIDFIRGFGEGCFCFCEVSFLFLDSIIV